MVLLLMCSRKSGVRRYSTQDTVGWLVLSTQDKQTIKTIYTSNNNVLLLKLSLDNHAHGETTTTKLTPSPVSDVIPVCQLKQY